jgi:hypothetical protein
MRRVKTAAIIAAELLGAFILVLVSASGDRYELFVRRSARVFQDGHELPDAHIFKGPQGRLLLTLDSRRSAPLIYAPDYREVLECNAQTFLDAGIFGLQKRSRDGRYPCAGSGKQELEQNVAYSNGTLGFNRWSDARRYTTCRMVIHGSNLIRDNH